MADTDELLDGKEYHVGVPLQSNAFYLRGSNSLDWGMKNRLAKIFSPSTGKTVMLAVDHGYFQGPTTGLERIDLSIVPLVPHADALMITRGALRTSIPPETSKPIVLRSSGGQSILKELSNELLAVDVEDALRLNAAAMAVQVYIGGMHEHQTLGNLVGAVDAGNRHGVPILAVTGVGKELARDSKYLGLATQSARRWAPMWSRLTFARRVLRAWPRPVRFLLVIAGGKKLEELDALKMAYDAIDQGAAGVDMGRNIFQCEAPTAM